MRITNKMMTNTSQTNINANKILLDKLNTQGTTYQKIARPSDDPVIAIRSLRLRTTLDELNQYYGKNVPDVRSWLEVTESALLSTRGAIKDMNQNFVSGASDTLTAEDRQKILDNLKALKDQIYSNGDTDYAGRNIFTGYRTATSLMFKEDTKLHYSITEVFGAKDVELLDYVKGQTEMAEFMGGINAPSPSVTPEATDISQEPVYRIRLSYDNLDGPPSGPGPHPGPTITTNPPLATFPSIVKTFNDNASRDAAYSPGPNDIFFLPQTGELVLGSARKDQFRGLPQGGEISLTYKKSEFAQNDLRPEHYFNCTSTDAFGNSITYDDFNQKMEVDVSFNQKLEINTNANEVFTHNIGRDLDEMITAIEEAIAVDTKLAELEKMLSDPAYQAPAQVKAIEQYIETAKKEKTFYKGKLKDMFGAGITKSQNYLDRVNLAITDVGGKDSRVELVYNRLKEQQTSIDDLSSKNDKVELSDVAIELAAAELAYQASLLATGKISGTSLLSYL